MVPSRNPPGRHDITYEVVQWHGTTRVVATCSCGKFTSPPYWARERAEAAANDHLTTVRYNKKKGD